MPKKPTPPPVEEAGGRKFAHSAQIINQAFNDFLRLQDIDQEILGRYQTF